MRAASGTRKGTASGAPWLERHQVALYVASIAVGAVVGLAVPVLAAPAGAAITPVLALLLYATFLAVPITRVRRALTAGRFLGAVVTVNFVVVPVVVLALAGVLGGVLDGVPGDAGGDRPALLLGVLIVLLAPCIDYVIVFTKLAGGASERLVATTPLLMLLQLVVVPLVLALAVGPDVLGLLDLGPFLGAFLFFIVLPLAAAGLTQGAHARGLSPAATLMDGAAAAMVPLMMATLAVVVASQIHRVGQDLTVVLLAVPVFVLFAAVMTGLGLLAGRVARLDVTDRRAVVFSGVTRNSLVVLPVTFALPEQFGIVPIVVVTQTLVELVITVILVRLVPALIPAR
ncbi:arsenic resistance protein [Tersicoccus phoenicis]|uniref:Arsenic resistance protein n=1 Tax=Tersicoccus phoenicis TaxID=554083 RepID=A0A1R1LC87_9MICC|nr:arsenic resistance protein [Tersicoccus phoenicis]OMH25128.1 arsenic resistance protein [Tersicoccus phoenicis]